MGRIPGRGKLAIAAGLLAVALASAGCSSTGFNHQLDAMVAPYHFSVAGWQSRTILQQTAQWLSGGQTTTDGGATAVAEYFALVQQKDALKSEITADESGHGADDTTPLQVELDRIEQQQVALAGTVERVIEAQITGVLSQQGIYNPVDRYVGWWGHLPPVNFKLEPLPHLLVVSPRDRIDSLREITVGQNITPDEMAGLETSVDRLGVSSLVVELGGLGATYPTFVTDDGDLRFTLETAAHEWLHQYLAFKPLGFLYLLDLTGLAPNYEIATMNETLADMFGDEVGSLVMQQYYPQLVTGQPARPPEFDFDQAMREIRRAVDHYLAQGQVDEAEAFMEQQRQYLADHGYYLRKLNQAYFAFHGAYADRPTSVSPIGTEMKELRGQSTSLKDFLETAAAMTSRQDLRLKVAPSPAQP
ncbi:MAG: hypothetical protein V1780_01650 [Chloroflexota bacterium]